jgi:hypothetical protein
VAVAFDDGERADGSAGEYCFIGCAEVIDCEAAGDEPLITWLYPALF